MEQSISIGRKYFSNQLLHHYGIPLICLSFIAFLSCCKLIKETMKVWSRNSQFPSTTISKTIKLSFQTICSNCSSICSNDLCICSNDLLQTICTSVQTICASICDLCKRSVQTICASVQTICSNDQFKLFKYLFKRSVQTICTSVQTICSNALCICADDLCIDL